MAVVLITGCASGFGKLAALHFARQGDTVFASMRDPARGEDLAKTVEGEKLSIKILKLDVNDEASVTGAVQQVIDAAGRIDVLVNNAGIGHRGPIEETDDAELKEVFETNFFGAMRVTRAVVPHMRKQGGGRIISVSSLAGVVTPPFDGVYSASKKALEAAAEALYYEVSPFGIKVALIEPGGFETNIENTRRVSRRFTEGSPYLDRAQRFEESLTRLSRRRRTWRRPAGRRPHLQRCPGGEAQAPLSRRPGRRDDRRSPPPARRRAVRADDAPGAGLLGLTSGRRHK